MRRCCRGCAAHMTPASGPTTNSSALKHEARRSQLLAARPESKMS